MNEPRALVEHFFRHEFGRLVAVLTRSLGVRRLDLVEDVVQAALVQALETWSRRGVPEDPAGWLYRTARNLATDALRREQAHARALPHLANEVEQETAPHEAHFADEIGDEPLRLLFVCCHEEVPAESRIAFALRTLCGFSTAEIARGLLTSEANVQKRIERADTDCATWTLNSRHRPAQLPPGWMRCSRSSTSCSVRAATPPMPMCRSAATCATKPGGWRGCSPTIPPATSRAVHALLALMCFHAARFDARVAFDGGGVLFEEQDRSVWNWGDVREGMAWFARSAVGDELTRYHVEASIAWEHCRAATFADTDWRRIAELYEVLDRIVPSPVQRSTAPSPKPTCTARKPGSIAWPLLLRKTSPPRIPLVRGHRRVTLPPWPARRRRARLARGTAMDERQYRRRVPASPPRGVPAFPRFSRLTQYPVLSLALHCRFVRNKTYENIR